MYETPGKLQLFIAATNAFIAATRGKLFRQTNATLLSGEGLSNGTYLSKLCSTPGMAKELFGITVIPMPAATICLIVSREEPSKVRCMPSLDAEYLDRSGHTSKT